MIEPEQKAARPKGTGCLFLRGDTWWLKYSRHGRVYRETTKLSDRKKAEKMLRTRLAELQTGTFIGPKTEKIRVEELADDLLRDYRINGKRSIDDVEARWEHHLKPFFGHLKAVDVTSSKTAEYVDTRQRENAANATINRELAALKRMFNLGAKATPPKVMRVPGFPHLEENNVRKGFLEDSQYQKLAESCSELWFRTLLEVGRTYGWRISELVSMRVKQIDLAQRTIRLEPGTTKNDEGREVVMTDAVYTLLSACVSGKTHDAYVFTWPDGKPIRDFRGTWKTVCKKAGVPDLLFHDLRRTAARNLRRAGISETVIMKIGGWKTPSVFQRYAIVSRNDIADAMLKLESSEQTQNVQPIPATAQNGHKNGHKSMVAVSAMPTLAFAMEN